MTSLPRADAAAPPPTVLRDELHAHLHGCIGADELWELGRDRWPRLVPRLDWFASEYLKSCGRRPDYAGYWRDADGRERLRADYVMSAAGGFAPFQARFNLLIALLPITPRDPEIVLHVLRQQRATGLRYGEYRCFVPPFFTDEDVRTYVATMAAAAATIAAESAGAFAPTLAFSLSRDEALFARQYAGLRAVLAADGAAARYVTGLDFCGDETGHPPAAKAAVFTRVLADNRADPARALAILYHVGETFTRMSLASAARWVHEAQTLGAHRLGHALGLGLVPTAVAARPDGDGTRERADERRAHLEWLRREAGMLRDHGFTVDVGAADRELGRLAALAPDAVIAVNQDSAALAETAALQDALMRDLARRGAIIECCPTSNACVGGAGGPGGIGAAGAHPLPRFLAAGLRVVGGADDPGLFATNLAAEGQRCQVELGLSAAAVSALQQTAAGSHAELLARR